MEVVPFASQHIPLSTATTTTTMNVLSAPVNLWHLYVEYLVNYKDDSWVASIASSFRVLAIVMCVPLALLILLVRIPPVPTLAPLMSALTSARR